MLAGHVRNDTTSMYEHPMPDYRHGALSRINTYFEALDTDAGRIRSVLRAFDLA